VTNDSSFCPPESSYLQPHRPSRQASTSGNVQPPASRPLSSADEAGPVPKKMRSTVRQPAKPKPTKLSAEEPLKKARARPALKFANFFSSSGRRSQPTASSRTASTGLGKNDRIPSNSSIATRRSSRLLSGNGSKQTGKVRYFQLCIFWTRYLDACLYTTASTNARSTAAAQPYPLSFYRI
jgi:anaphase-promoting complex subunit 3